MADPMHSRRFADDLSANRRALQRRQAPRGSSRSAIRERSNLKHLIESISVIDSLCAASNRAPEQYRIFSANFRRNPDANRPPLSRSSVAVASNSYPDEATQGHQLAISSATPSSIIVVILMITTISSISCSEIKALKLSV